MTKRFSTRRAAARLPGDLNAREAAHRMIRVDHAGEYGAVRIYDGQRAVLGGSEIGPLLDEMTAHEEAHLKTFENLITERGVRPTALLPLWHAAGFALGAGSALMGPKAAMACTAAVEEAIDEHYAAQVRELDADADTDGAEPELRETCERFRQEEAEHRETALAHGAEDAPGYGPLSRAVKRGAKIAIWLSERL